MINRLQVSSRTWPDPPRLGLGIAQQAGDRVGAVARVSVRVRKDQARLFGDRNTRGWVCVCCGEGLVGARRLWHFDEVGYLAAGFTVEDAGNIVDSRNPSCSFPKWHVIHAKSRGRVTSFVAHKHKHKHKHNLSPHFSLVFVFVFVFMMRISLCAGVQGQCCASTQEVSQFPFNPLTRVGRKGSFLSIQKYLLN